MTLSDLDGARAEECGLGGGPDRLRFSPVS